MAGLGVNLGISDVAILYKLLLHNSAVGGDWGMFLCYLWGSYFLPFEGILAGLLSYEQRSQCLNLPVMSVIDGLQKLFSNSSVPTVACRSLGLHLTSASPLIKVFYI